MAKTLRITTPEDNPDLKFLKGILPAHYTVQPGSKSGSIRCKSAIGIRHKIDADDEEHWDYIVKAIKAHFADRFQEIDHNTCFCHVDFMVYHRAGSQSAPFAIHKFAMQSTTI